MHVLKYGIIGYQVIGTYLPVTSESNGQYKYYKKNVGSSTYGSRIDTTKKPTINSPATWWLRTQYSNQYCFLVNIYGYAGMDDVNKSWAVAPGFCI